jgi:hypothetical protein
MFFLEIPHAQVNQPTITLFGITNVMTAARIKIAVLIGVKEQVALYPSKHDLLAFASGISVTFGEGFKSIAHFLDDL